MADESKRESLKIIGAIGTTCAFPFAADELYGQHEHPKPGEQAKAGQPRFFTAGEMSLLALMVDHIIPKTDTPGAAEAGVPAYIDLVVSANKGHQSLYRAGLAWMEREGYRGMTAAARQAKLEALCEAADTGRLNTPGARFFRVLKNMTCDGYYTSKAGMGDELGFAGPSVLEAFPSCEIPEH